MGGTPNYPKAPEGQATPKVDQTPPAGGPPAPPQAAPLPGRPLSPDRRSASPSRTPSPLSRRLAERPTAITAGPPPPFPRFQLGVRGSDLPSDLRVVRPFCQADHIAQIADLRRQNPGGVCLALSLQWIAVSANAKENFWEYVRTDTCVAETNRLQTFEVRDVAEINAFNVEGLEARRDRKHAAHKETGPGYINQIAGLEVSDHFRSHDIARACARIAASTGYALIRLNGDRRSHAIAAFVGDDQVVGFYLMDANHGEIGCNNNQAAKYGFQGHIEEMFSNSGSLLGNFNHLEVDLFYSRQTPGNGSRSADSLREQERPSPTRPTGADAVPAASSATPDSSQSKTAAPSSVDQV